MYQHLTFYLVPNLFLIENFNFFNWCVDFWERGSGRERETWWFVIPLMHAFTGCFLYMTWPEINLQPWHMGRHTSQLSSLFRARSEFLQPIVYSLKNWFFNLSYSIFFNLTRILWILVVIFNRKIWESCITWFLNPDTTDIWTE